MKTVLEEGKDSWYEFQGPNGNGRMIAGNLAVEFGEMESVCCILIHTSRLWYNHMV